MVLIRKKQSQAVRNISAIIFEKILVLSLTTITKKNGSEATLDTLENEKLKFAEKN